MINNRILHEEIQLLAETSLWRKLSGKTLLITGATGMLGSYLAYSVHMANITGGYGIKLLLTGRNVSKASALTSKINCNFLIQDIRKPLDIDVPVHYIIHTAGPVGPAVFSSKPEEVLSVNIQGTLSLLDYAIRHNCQGFVFASTHEVYGRANGEQKEDMMSGFVDPQNPRSSYILAKLAAENALACYAAKYGINAVSARLSRIYGPLMNLDSGLFICDFINDIINRRPITVKGEINLIRPLCYIRDAAEAMLRLVLNAEESGAYNVQGIELPSIGEIAELLSVISACPVKYMRPETRRAEKSGHWLNTDKLRQLGWKQVYSLEEGLRRTVEYFAGVGDEK